jgi:WD40 repeat protein
MHPAEIAELAVYHQLLYNPTRLFSTEGQLLASCSEDGTIKVWDVRF